jgi:hypothetical protein
MYLDTYGAPVFTITVLIRNRNGCQHSGTPFELWAVVQKFIRLWRA